MHLILLPKYVECLAIQVKGLICTCTDVRNKKKAKTILEFNFSMFHIIQNQQINDW
jgi:hypothetical protein